MPENNGVSPGAPESRVVSRRRTRLSLVWLVPIVAALAGAWIAVTKVLGEGPEITIVFASASGLEAGKTKIDYDGVEVGTVKEIRLSDDHQRVIVTAQMAPKTEGFLVENTNFWVVRPRISGGSVSGLGTLISGAYIGMEIGDSTKAQRRFEALDAPPVLTAGVPGRSFVLKTPNLGSLENGTPIFFRRLKVGEIVSYKLEADGKTFRVEAFVDAPYDQYVTPSTRFWHASGIDLSLTAAGLQVQTESLVSILVGGVAFETAATAAVLPAAEEGAGFTLFADRAAAFRPAPIDPTTYELIFKQTVRGLEPGAPVEFRGVLIGDVVDVTGVLDPTTIDFSVRVTVRLDLKRFGAEIRDPGSTVDQEALRRKTIDALISHGVRAQLQSGSLLTGALFVAFDFFPDAPPATVDWSQQLVALPTIPGTLETLEANVEGIVKKLGQIDFKAIGADVQKALVDLDATLVSVRGTVDDAGALIAPNSVLVQQLEGTLQEVSGAARSLRVLADYLERHPEALIEGKTGEAK